MRNETPTRARMAITLLVAGLCGGCLSAPPSSDPLAEQAVSRDKNRALAAMAGLREEGQTGLDRLLRRHAPIIEDCHAVRGGQEPGCDTKLWLRVRKAVETVAQQRDATRSGLFWHTELESAKAQAAATGRPILSLRLLGRLDEEMTCANSRFFRTVLYADAGLSRELRERFVLHWESVREVPKVRIDLGDGRVLATTLTGNSAHLALTSDGAPLDVMPGLVGSGTFGRWLEDVEALAQELDASPVERHAELIQAYHHERLNDLESRLAADLEAVEEELGITVTPPEDAFDEDANGDDLVFSTGSFTTYPDGTKANVELPIVNGLVPDTPALEQWFGNEVWSAIARRHESKAALDQRSRDLARWKSVQAEDGLAPLFERLQRSVAEEGVRTQYLGHRAVHRWFLRGEVSNDLDALTERLYGELFGLPTNDAWLGLVPPDAYRAIDEDGLSG